jgi:uncharacterized membrane protein YfcA
MPVTESSSNSDLAPILWKWLVRLLWLGSIGLFQGVELHRYLSGQTYRPFFALYAGVLCALVAWFAVSAAAGVSRRRRARLQSH